MGIPLIFKVDPDGFYLYARGDKSKVCAVYVMVTGSVLVDSRMYGNLLIM